MRVFKSRSSEGVNGMDLEAGDEVISMSVIDHVEVAIEERDEYLRVSGARRRQGDEADAEAQESDELALLSPERFAELEAKEQLLLTITVNGFGKRTSALEYRVTNRGGQGIINIETSARNGRVAATFPVGETDQIMLVTDTGPDHPHPGARYPGRQPEHAGRQAVHDRARRAHRLDRALGGGRERRRGGGRGCRGGVGQRARCPLSRAMAAA